MEQYTAPLFEAEGFHCPQCGIYAHQYWDTEIRVFLGSSYKTIAPEKFAVSVCVRCEDLSIWHEKQLLYPAGGTAPRPHPDTPTELKKDYEEARAVVTQSPRASCALLRLLVQKICKTLGEKGENLNDDIKKLVKNGLPVEIQQRLDIVRVIGNNAVHPGEIALTDDVTAAIRIFTLVNEIIESRIASPKRLKEAFERLPDGAKEQIERRDKK